MLSTLDQFVLSLVKTKVTDHPEDELLVAFRETWLFCLWKLRPAESWMLKFDINKIYFIGRWIYWIWFIGIFIFYGSNLIHQYLYQGYA